jgi:hypothetical protein
MSKKQIRLEVAKLLEDAARRDYAPVGFNPVLYARRECLTCRGSGLDALHVCACVWNAAFYSALKTYSQMRGDGRLHCLCNGPSKFDWVLDYERLSESLRRSSAVTVASFGRDLVRRELFPLSAYLGKSGPFK